MLLNPSGAPERAPKPDRRLEKIKKSGNHTSTVFASIEMSLLQTMYFASKKRYKRSSNCVKCFNNVESQSEILS